MRNEDLIRYYDQRAQEYDTVYLKPEWQLGLGHIEMFLKMSFFNCEVFEVACGTGFWTEKISLTSKSVHAADANESVIQIARKRCAKRNNVKFEVSDFFSMDSFDLVDGVFGGFIWSHIDLVSLDSFLSKVHNMIKPGGKVIFLDTNYLKGHNRPITETDAAGNTYQKRDLLDGSTHLVLKNFPSAEDITLRLSNISTDLIVQDLKYFWMASYKVKP